MSILFAIVLLGFIVSINSSPVNDLEGVRSPALPFLDPPHDDTFENGAESQQVEVQVDVQKPIVQEPVKQEPVKQEPVKQEPIKQEPVKQEPVKSEPVKQLPVKQEPVKQEPIKQEVVKQEPIKTGQDTLKENTESISEEERTNVVGGGVCCGKAKPDYSKAIAIAVKGNALAAAATAGVAAPAVIKSAKVAAIAGLIPIKLAAKGALIGGLIAKPIIIKSAIVGATAAKLSHLFVGKPIAIGANVLAGAEALRAKLAAKKVKCVTPTCV